MSTLTSGSTVLRLGGNSIRLRHRTIAAILGALAVLVAVALWSAATGSTALGLDRTWAALLGQGTKGDEFILWDLRLPRLATGLAVGACMGLSGALFQNLTRNALGSPDILGLTQGATSGALVAIILTDATLQLTAGFAALGALATGLVIWALTRGGDPSGYRLVLVGIGVAAILAGVNGYLLTRTTIVDAFRAVYWLTGDLSGRDWGQARTVAIVLGAGLIVVALLSRGLDALRLGEASATGLGVHVTGTRVTALVTASVLTAGAVAVAGPLAFVALAAPHIAARLTGSTRSFMLSAIIGALIVTGADMIAVVGVGDRQLPTGVVTGVVGGLYLVWLLIAQRKKGVMS
ncbi:iron chelate uptake ABC transporter family permease subunit [Glycomyces luteolus]|uniref:Iron chelate uptake ABC transporter family permease subunit n=1 Tax=Glycomyces luteolus TaxID=2670330 RepID=A0A9X3STP4_9ACTN|nr:iron chelate uptake ABC transporter family permease subunit [Glycomyces luteolus]MDA1360463.1 iron chelate uptake ABC transporter family permease subunit [Glycomyces luteolus]